MDFYVDYGFASSIYDDWFWKIFYEKGSKGNKFSIWISDFDVYEEQRTHGNLLINIVVKFGMSVEWLCCR